MNGLSEGTGHKYGNDCWWLAVVAVVSKSRGEERPPVQRFFWSNQLIKDDFNLCNPEFYFQSESGTYFQVRLEQVRAGQSASSIMGLSVSNKNQIISL